MSINKHSQKNNKKPRTLVPEEKSSNSTKAVLSPLVCASKATPAPVAPPPITRISNSSSLNPFKSSFLEGRGPDGRRFNCCCLVSKRLEDAAYARREEK